MPDAQGPVTLRSELSAGSKPARGARRTAFSLTTLIAASVIFAGTPAQAGPTHEVRVVNSTGASLLMQSAAEMAAAREQQTARSKKRSGPDIVPAKLEALQSYISGKYRVQSTPLKSVIETAWSVGSTMQLDPLLLLAVMAIESNFDPRAESGKGAQGLMQVMTRVHREKFARFGGTKAAWHPEANIQVGAQILRDCIDRRGSVPAGLTCYVGSPGKASAYGRKVLAERERLRAAVLPERLASIAATAAAQSERKPAGQQLAAVADKPAARAVTPRETTLGQAAHDGDISNESFNITASLALREVSALDM